MLVWYENRYPLMTPKLSTYFSLNFILTATWWPYRIPYRLFEQGTRTKWKSASAKCGRECGFGRKYGIRYKTNLSSRFRPVTDSYSSDHSTTRGRQNYINLFNDKSDSHVFSIKNLTGWFLIFFSQFVKIFYGLWLGIHEIMKHFL